MIPLAERSDSRRFRRPVADRVWTVGRYGLLSVVAAIVCMGPSRAWPLDLPASLAAALALQTGGEAALVEASLTPLEQRLFSDAADGRLDEFTLLAAALVASGADSTEVLARYQERFDALMAEFSPDPSADCDRKMVEA
ncbi:MAG: hypothetical protein U1E05_09640, partial [Patescibacteria group bacterium]|nr:hypothetical protein [Patescibacteria group bacterium]